MMKITLDSDKLTASARKLVARLNLMKDSLADDEARDIVDKLCDKLLEESVKRAPIDEGNLQNSHQKLVRQEAGSALSNRNVGYVYIPANSPAADYAMLMHEGEYKLGEISKQKQAGQSEVVGRKFLERALLENSAAWSAYIVSRLMGFFRRQT